MSDIALDPCVSARLATPEANQANIPCKDITSSPHLLTLPAEIRLMIYEYIFAKELVCVPDKLSDSPKLWQDKLQWQRLPKYQYALFPLMVCRQIRREAMPTFYAFVTFDLKSGFELMSKVSELGPGICQNIASIRVSPRLVSHMADYLREGTALPTNYQHLLPSLRHVYMSKYLRLSESDLQRREFAIKALRILLGHDDLQVHIGRHPRNGP